MALKVAEEVRSFMPAPLSLIDQSSHLSKGRLRRTPALYVFWGPGEGSVAADSSRVELLPESGLGPGTCMRADPMKLTPSGREPPGR